MSDIRFNNWKHQSGTGGVSQNSGGNVGIGSTLPSSKLDVGGDGKFTGVVTATSLTVNGDVTLGNTLASDEVTFNSKVNTNLLPSTDGNKDLGSSGNRWGEVHAATFHGSGANLTGLSAGLTMADQWRVSTSQSTSAHTIADITAWSRNNNNFAGVGDALTNSGANFTFPSTGIYYISYNIATYITSGSARYISARLYYNGQDICHSWSSAHHGASSGQTLMSTGSQAIIDVPNTSYTFKIRLQSSEPVTIVGLNEAGYNSSVNMSEVVVMRLGDT